MNNSLFGNMKQSQALLTTTLEDHPLNSAINGLRTLKLTSSSPSISTRQGYRQTNLLTDDPANLGKAGDSLLVDKSLVNPWGVSFSPTGPFWVSDNGTGVTTLYNGNGQPFPFPPQPPLVVTIPPPKDSPAGTVAAPTGQVFNSTTSDFVVSKDGHPRDGKPAVFLFVTEDGTISGWNPQVDPTHAILAVDSSASGAVYKGLALLGDSLYAADFHNNKIDIFSKDFHLDGSFTDPQATQLGFAPFNIQNLGGKLYVTFAKQNGPDNHDDQAGPGNGFIDVFDPSNDSLTRLASGTAVGGKNSALNSPWGLALAPADFGKFSHDLLVGNFGSGQIDAFDPNSGAFLGKLRDISGKPIQIDGLWSLTFGNGGQAGKTNELFFTAGINDEQHGLFGKIQAESTPPNLTIDFGSSAG